MIFTAMIERLTSTLNGLEQKFQQTKTHFFIPCGALAIDSMKHLVMRTMKIKYLYQQLASHLSVIIVAFLILSLLFSHYVEKFVYDTKTEELVTYGSNILNDIERNQRNSNAV